MTELDDGSIDKSAVFTNNVAGKNGGAIYSPAYATLEIPEATVFEGNTVTDVSAMQNVFYSYRCVLKETVYREKARIMPHIKQSLVRPSINYCLGQPRIDAPMEESRKEIFEILGQ